MQIFPKLKVSNPSYYPEREVALMRDEYKCRDCSATEKLVVHHKDGSRIWGTSRMNNSLSNLITLCQRCHARAHGYTKVDREADAMIISLRADKWGWREIGDFLGISHERARQIYSRANKNST